MSPECHLVRIGRFGQIGRFSAATGEIVTRGLRVVCRTSRGLEVGIVLREPAGDDRPGTIDGTLLRRMTPEDELLLARLERDRERAYSRCARLLDKRKLGVTLVDVEHLFDGRSLFFYFLGEITPEVEALTQELAETYEATVRLRQFAHALQHGCGPGCGTESAGGCGTACSGCAVAGSCAK